MLCGVFFLPGSDSLRGWTLSCWEIGLIGQLRLRGPRELSMDRLNEISGKLFHSGTIWESLVRREAEAVVLLQRRWQSLVVTGKRDVFCLFNTVWLLSVPQLALKDPVHTVSLQQFIYEKLKAQQELLGEQGFQSLMETVDTEIVTQLQEFLQGFWEHMTCGCLPLRRQAKEPGLPSVCESLLRWWRNPSCITKTWRPCIFTTKLSEYIPHN